MAVVAALELDDHVAPGRAARQAQRTHRRLGARADEAHLLHARHVFQDLFGQLDFALGRRTEGKALVHRAMDRFFDRRVTVAEDHRPPGADVIDVALSLGVDEVRAFGAGNEARRAADGAKGAHR